MTDHWSDERIEHALVGLAGELDVPPADSIEPLAARRRRATRRRRLLVAAAVLALAVAAALAITPSRETVARWFGLHVERDDGTGAAVTDAFADDVLAMDVATAIERSGLDRAHLESAGLGVPDAAGLPPEGGVVLTWGRGATTLWVRSYEARTEVVVKRLVGDDRAEVIDGVGDYAVLIDGAHVLETPARTVAAGRVLWWLWDGRELRLESDLDAGEMLATARALTP
jgi:hypothetical protein